MTNSTLNVAKLVTILRHRLKLEPLSEHFSVREFRNKFSKLKLDPTNCILFETKTLKHLYPDDYESDTYRFIFIAGLHDETDLRTYSTDFTDIAEHNIDHIFVWTAHSFTAEVHHILKKLNVRLLRIAPHEIKAKRHLSNFVFDNASGDEELIQLNAFADSIVIRLKKLFHFVLSEIAAPVYDRTYGKEHIATDLTRKFEREVILEAATSASSAQVGIGPPGNKAPSRKTRRQKQISFAVDVGCGTGDHALELRDKFDKVFAFDFSQAMIKRANQKKKRLDAKNVTFTVCDIEHESVWHEEEFRGRCDLVVASFGMASFVEDLSRFLRRIHTWLRETGKAVLCFYNSNGILDRVTPNWRDTSLQAHLDKKNFTLRVSIADLIFHIYCRAFDGEAKSTIEEFFKISKIYSYPTSLALLPNSLLSHQVTRDLFSHLDQSIAASDEFRLGHYVIVELEKTGQRKNTEERVRDLLHAKGIEAQENAHEEMFSAEDVAAALAVPLSRVVKCLVVYGDPRREHPTCFVIPGSMQLDIAKISEVMGVKLGRVQLATKKDLFKLGFSLGSVSVFGMLDGDVRVFVNEELTKGRDDEKFVFASGNNRLSYSVTGASLAALLAEFETFA